ncbi:hypothetical protein [Solimonas soli]|uniref:hypothetical protein n=1 Tax=Solimonas soli TaxID=413479 RepID=UPI0006870E59|nr:hypothetical protein [Solimonas soli]
MRKTFSIGTLIAACLTAALGGGLAGADELAVPAVEGSAQQPKPLVLPHRGQSEATVLREFGEPKLRHAPAGGGKPQHPPITRWDYDGYSVFFERTTVVDVVIKGDPPPLSHVDELKPARTSGE